MLLGLLSRADAVDIFQKGMAQQVSRVRAGVAAGKGALKSGSVAEGGKSVCERTCKIGVRRVLIGEISSLVF